MLPLPPLLSRKLQVAAEHRLKKIGIDEFEMMETLGRSMAKSLEKIIQQLKPDALIFLIGPGNNGGDGLSILRHLKNQKNLHIFCERSKPSELNNKQWKLLDQTKVVLHDFSQAKPKLELDKKIKKVLIVDALLGLGAQNKPLSAGLLRLLDELKCAQFSRQYVVAIDVPSGLLESAARIEDFKFLKAHETFSVASVKYSLIHGEGVEASGKIKIFSLGRDIRELIADSKDLFVGKINEGLGYLRSQYLLNFKNSTSGEHKNSRGRVLLIGGELSQGGALKLAAESAMRAGAGYATILQNQKEKYTVSDLQEWTLKNFSEVENYEKFFKEYTAITFGCGMNPHSEPELNKKFWNSLETYQGVLVLDAGGLLPFLKKTKCNPRETIFTPHPGEAARILKSFGKDTGENRLELFEDLKSLLISQGRSGVVLLKGAYPICAELKKDSKNFYFNLADYRLATAGSGDVLSGFLAGIAEMISVREGRSLSLLLLGLFCQKMAIKKLNSTALARDILINMGRSREKLWQAF